MNEVVFFDRASSTCMVCGLIRRHDPTRQMGWMGGVLRLDGLVGEHRSTPCEWRDSFIRCSRARAAGRGLGWW